MVAGWAGVYVPKRRGKGRGRRLNSTQHGELAFTTPFHGISLHTESFEWANCVVKVERLPGYAGDRVDWDGLGCARWGGPLLLSGAEAHQKLFRSKTLFEGPPLAADSRVGKTLKLQGFFLCRPPHGACSSCTALLFGWLCGRLVDWLGTYGMGGWHESGWMLARRSSSATTSCLLDLAKVDRRGKQT